VSVPDPSPELLQRAAAVRRAAMALGQLSDGERRAALLAMADALEADRAAIVAANAADLEAAAAENLAPALVARLKLDAPKLAAAIEGVRQVAALADPLGVRQLHRELDDGLVLERLSVPLGVVGVIFEARPDAVMQIAALAIRSGNGAILKGGREASRSCAAILAALQRGLAASAVAPEALALLTSREESLALLKLDGLVDLIIPRGSNALVQFIQDNTRIPVLGHADGICHLYVDREVAIDQALRVALPATVGQFITLLQDTTLLSLIGLLDLLGTARTVMANPAFLGKNAEVYLVLAVLFWCCCAALGLGSRALETRLNTHHTPAKA